MGPLAGVRVVEFAGIGPAPFCGMLLADLGADVLLVERKVPNANTAGVSFFNLGRFAIYHRGKRAVATRSQEAGRRRCRAAARRMRRRAASKDFGPA